VTRRLRLGIVTSGYPYTTKEAFLEPELRALAQHAELRVYPVNPSLRRQRLTDAESVRIPIVSLTVLGDALLEFVRHPSLVLRAFRAVAFCGTWRARAKNAAVFCKALAVARDMRRYRIGHVHAYWASTPATVAYVVALINGTSWSFTAHRWDIYEDNLLADKARHARFVRVVSRRARTAVLERTEAAEDKVRVLHVGVARADFARCDMTRPFSLICAANLEPVKGHRTLIEALNHIAARGTVVRCVLAGDGSLHNSLAAAIDAARLGSVVCLAGCMPHDRLLGDLATGSYDAAVLASIEDGDVHEGIPVFLMEAMAAGLPCVATKTGSIEELIDADVGILVAQRDPPELARAIELLAGDADLRARFGHAARERIAQGFDAERLAAELFSWIHAGSEATRRTTSETTLARS